MPYTTIKSFQVRLNAYDIPVNYNQNYGITERLNNKKYIKYGQTCTKFFEQ